MTYRIHFEYPSGDEDSVVIEGDTIDEIRKKADYEVEKRGGLNPWSELISTE